MRTLNDNDPLPMKLGAKWIELATPSEVEKINSLPDGVMQDNVRWVDPLGCSTGSDWTSLHAPKPKRPLAESVFETIQKRMADYFLGVDCGPDSACIQILKKEAERVSYRIKQLESKS